MAGQSNTEGGALIDNATPVNQADYGPDFAPVTYSYHYENNPNPDVVGAFGALRSDSGYHGWEISLGRELDTALGGGIAIIKFTQGGSNLHTDWNETLTNLYDDFITHVNTQVATLQLSHASVELRGMFWHQGESDSDELPALAYESNLLSFFDQVRVDLSTPDLNFIAGKLNETGSWAMGTDWEDDVNAAIQSAADSNSYISTIATTDDISLLPDGLHYASDGHIELGKRMADSYIQNFTIPETSVIGLLLAAAIGIGLQRRR